ncbi:MAG: 23S rRNA (guanosine(2251)-2'-O)-methyltransferase RlmB [Lachnospiraceae bacterium]|nr:23S rRNA (guanosine(2251)-2'-O)-methyltransferase RlmB [Lachnospiraceae bacterium]
MPERIEGRNAVREALKAGRPLEKLYIQKGLGDSVIRQITEEAAGQGLRPFLTEKDKLDEMSETGRHQGVIAEIAAYTYAEISDMLQAARERNEDPFLLLLDGIEDPHNLGAILRSAHLAGAHGVIIPKNRAVGLNATVAKVSAGAIHYIPVARVTNLSRTMEELKKEGLWFVCADMDGEIMYRQNLTGPIGLVIGSEGDGVSQLVKKHCDFITSIPMSGKIDSLNASVAAGILAFEIVRQRKYKG